MRYVADLIDLYILILLIRAVLSWVLPPNTGGGWGEFNRVIFWLTEPLLRPIRAVLPVARIGQVGIDLSLFVLLLILYIIRGIL